MKKNIRLSFQKGDLLAIVLVLSAAVAVGAAFWSAGQQTDPACVQIYQDGVLIRELALAENQTFEIVGKYTNMVEIRNGKAAIIASDCPGEDCVHTGPVDSTGRSIVCLPNQVEIRISGASEVDFVVG